MSVAAMAIPCTDDFSFRGSPASHCCRKMVGFDSYQAAIDID